MLSDVKRAYFHAPTDRELYVELPKEDPKWKLGLLGKPRLSLYGTRDAAANWQRCVSEHLVSIGFKPGKSNPCVSFGTPDAGLGHLSTGTVARAQAPLTNFTGHAPVWRRSLT